ncbi:hypothetical protein KAU32_12305 [bacterium]|nr:hypothetical protein [bacterium]
MKKFAGIVNLEKGIDQRARKSLINMISTSGTTISSNEIIEIDHKLLLYFPGNDIICQNDENSVTIGLYDKSANGERHFGSVKGNQEFTQKISELKNGFAICYWDKNNKSFTLARDHNGLESVYYLHLGNYLIFSNKPGIIAGFYKYSKRLNLEALDCYISAELNYFEETFFRDIYRLFPGNYLFFNKGSIEIKKYWQLNFNKNDLLTESDSVNLLESGILSVLKKNIGLNKSEKALLLSAGLDSNYLLGLFSEIKQKTIPTITGGYSGKFEFDEVDRSQKSAKHFGSEHTSVKLGIDEFKDLIFGKYVSLMDEPNANVSNITLYYILKKAKERYNLLISGIGADALFYSSPNDFRFYKLHNIYQILEVSGLGSLFELLKEKLCHNYHFDFRLKNIFSTRASFIRGIRTKREFQYYSKFRIYNEKMQTARKRGQALFKELTKDYINELGKRYEVSDLITYLDYKMVVQRNFIDSTSQIAAEFDITVLHPYIAPEFLEKYSTIPEKIKFKHGQPKYLERMMAKRKLPEWIFDTPKIPFKVPHMEWISTYLKEDMLEVIRNGIIMKEIINPKGFENYLNYSNSMLLIWRLFILEKWLRLYF